MPRPPRPEGPTVHLTVRLYQPLHQALRVAAIHQGRTLEAFVADALADAIGWADDRPWRGEKGPTTP